MRKLMAMAFVLMLIPGMALASATDARGAFEFCELFGQRFAELVMDGELDYDLSVEAGYASPLEIDGKIIVSVTPGMMSINKNDYTVHSIEMTLLDMNATDEKNEQNVMMCIAALSALEYDSVADDLFAHKAKAFDCSASAIEEALSIWNDWMAVRLTDKVMQHIVDTEDRTLIYAGNYDYYVSHSSIETSEKQLNYFALTAEEHK